MADERQRLSELASSAAFERLMTRAQLIVDHFGVVNCWLGEEIGRQMTSFQEASADLT
jgi:hypothetical protein